MKTCPKCKLDHTKLGVYCSRQCANSRTWSTTHKLKLSNKLKGKRISTVPEEFRRCLICNTEFCVKLWSTKKYCSRSCVAKKCFSRPKSQEHKRKLRLAAIEDWSKKGKCRANYNKLACKIFTEINNTLGWNGLHAENYGEFFIKDLGYWVDYFEPSKNIVIEFDEPHHKYKQTRDTLRQIEIEKHLGCTVLRITPTTDISEFILKLKYS